MAESNLKISVVIPTLNEENYLGKCLKSFRNQTFTNFEIIIVDGGSTDKTIEIAKKFKAKVIQLKHSSICLARQKGVEESSGEIIVGADADNIYPPSHLARIIEDFARNPQIVAVGGRGIFERHPIWTYLGWNFAYFIFSKIYELFKIVVYIPAFNLSFRKKTFLKLGGYRTYLDFGGDELDILERLKKEGLVYFDTQLYSFASSRRAKVGFWQLMIKHTLIDYYLNYFLAKIFKRTIIKGKPVR